MNLACRTTLLLASLAALASFAGLAQAQTAEAGIEASTSDGRRVLLKSDGTWKFADAAAATSAQAAASAASAPADIVPAELLLLSRSGIPGGCQFQLELHNQLGYEIQGLVPDFKVFRRGVAYVEQSVGFSRVLPGDKQQRALRVMGVQCGDVDKLLVTGGDRCVMGELNRFSSVKGLCLARIKVRGGDAGLAFEK